MFEEIEPSSKKTILFHIFFIARRYILVVILVSFPKKYITQIILMLTTSTFMFCYMIVAKPYKNPKVDSVELFNEAFICFSCYFLFLFTDFVDTPIQFKLGWCLIAFLALNLSVNVSIMAID